MSDENDSGVFTLARQGGITFAGNVLGRGLGFAFVAVATRLVTPSEYGVFTLGLSIVLFVQGFASLNIYRSVDYFVPQFLSDSNYGQAKKHFRMHSLSASLRQFSALLFSFLPENSWRRCLMNLRLRQSFLS